VIGLGGIQCDLVASGEQMLTNPLLNQGDDRSRCSADGPCPGVVFRANGDAKEAANLLLGNCQKARSDQIIQFLLFGLALGSIFLTFLFWKNGKPSKRSGTYV
jgi:hypothetical protein